MNRQSALLKIFQKEEAWTAPALAKRLKISRQAIHRHLKSLLNQGIILKQGTSRKTTFYLLNSPATLERMLKRSSSSQLKKRYKVKGLEEEEVYLEVKAQPFLLSPLLPQAQTLFQYGFTEMVNNAMDHSRSQHIEIFVSSTPQNIFFSVTDYGIGIFENIRKKKGLVNEWEAIQDLLKGKQTTLPQYHSGEGIFFTSKVVDRLVIESHRKKLTLDNKVDEIFVSDIRRRKGTRVSFEMNPFSKKRLEDVFREYTNEEFQFQKSQVRVKLFKGSEEYMSRSQAKRLLHALNRFQEIVLDFKGIETIGQGFADEVFRVFASQHPEMKIVPIHCHENVQFMINRAQSAQSVID